MIPCQRHLFDIPREVAYLNCAYMAPLMHEVAEAGRAGLDRKRRPWEIRAADFFDGTERLRALFARVIGGEAEGVAVVPSASYGLAVAAANLPLRAGSRVVVAEHQFPSNLLVWREKAQAAGAEVVAVRPGPDGDLTGAFLAAIDERTAIVAAAHCRWTDGALMDPVRIGGAARAVGAATVWDLTQSAGALAFPLADADPDFVVAATYKWLLGPYSFGFLHAAARRCEGRPIEESWMIRDGAEDFTRLAGSETGYRPGARRYDMGEAASFSATAAATAALAQIEAWGVAAIQATLAARTAGLAARAGALGLASLPEGLRAGHFLGLALPGPVPPGLTERLAAAHVHVSLRGASLRVTPHLWNDEADCDRLIEVLAQAL